VRDSNLYFVAHQLHMLVSDLEARITYREFCGWLTYFRDQQQEQLKAVAAPPPPARKGPNMMEVHPAVIAAMFKGD
jgi:hypothetical protein